MCIHILLLIPKCYLTSLYNTVAFLIHSVADVTFPGIWSLLDEEVYFGLWHFIHFCGNYGMGKGINLFDYYIVILMMIDRNTISTMLSVEGRSLT